MQDANQSHHIRKDLAHSQAAEGLMSRSTSPAMMQLQQPAPNGQRLTNALQRKGQNRNLNGPPERRAVELPVPASVASQQRLLHQQQEQSPAQSKKQQHTCQPAGRAQPAPQELPAAGVNSSAEVGNARSPTDRPATTGVHAATAAKKSTSGGRQGFVNGGIGTSILFVLFVMSLALATAATVTLVYGRGGSTPLRLHPALRHPVVGLRLPHWGVGNPGGMVALPFPGVMAACTTSLSDATPAASTTYNVQSGECAGDITIANNGVTINIQAGALNPSRLGRALCFLRVG